VSNHYLSAISYEPRTTAVISAEALRAAAGFQAYEMEEDSSKDLAEFALANAIYTALVEGHAAEISARRTAMENASNVSVIGAQWDVMPIRDIMNDWGRGLTLIVRTPTT
jgi:F0F1-type ATP synthase gamma subunit